MVHINDVKFNWKDEKCTLNTLKKLIEEVYAKDFKQQTIIDKKTRLILRLKIDIRELLTPVETELMDSRHGEFKKSYVEDSAQKIYQPDKPC